MATGCHSELRRNVQSKSSHAQTRRLEVGRVLTLPRSELLPPDDAPTLVQSFLDSLSHPTAL